jgi:CubicO group peptidase (beta-lactamase class C family)
MTNLKRALFLVSFLLVLGNTVASARGSADLDAQMERALRDWHTPGMTVAVVKDDHVILTKGYGVRKLGAPEKVDEQTLFALGSTSKAFAAATVCILVGEDAVRWDDRVRGVLPWLEVYNPWVSNELTIRDLLAHRVGTSYVDENRSRAYAKDARDLLERGKWLKPVAPFRASYVYSNNMFIAAGQVVATVTGKPWAEFARERLWAPLGMSGTEADSHMARANADAAWPHIGPEGQDPTPVPWEYPDAVAVPSGGVNSNAHDMAQWLRFQLAEGAIDGHRLIKREIFQQMQLPQTAITNPGAAPDIQSQYPDSVRETAKMRLWAYGLGWYVTEYRGRKFVYHSGSIDGFRAGVGLLPEEGIAVYVGVNRTPSMLPMAMMLVLFDAYLDTPRADWSGMFLKSRQATKAGAG